MSNDLGGLLEIGAAAAAEGIALAGASREYCANCGTKFAGPFCTECGEERDTHRRSVFGLMHDFFEDLLSLDSRLLRTSAALVAMPGELPSAFREGRVRRYVPPIRLYFFVSLLFFLTLSISGVAIMQISLIEKTLTASQVSEVQKAIAKAKAEEAAAAKKRQAAEAAALKAAGNGPGAKAVKESFTISGDDDSVFQISQKDVSTAGSWPALRAQFFMPVGTAPKISPAMQKHLDMIKSKLDAAEKKLVAKGEGAGWGIWFVRRAQAAMLAIAKDPASVNGPLTDWIPRALFLLLPAYALLLALFYVRQRREYYFVDHLVFSVNVHTFGFVLLIAAVLLAPWVHSEGLDWALLAAFAVYLFMALKRFYRQGWFMTAFKFASLSFIYFCFFLMPVLGIVIAVSVLEA